MASLLKRIDEKNDAKYDAVNDDSQGRFTQFIGVCGRRKEGSVPQLL
jgi:hypothetical protein